MKNKSIGLIIPTWNSKKRLESTLKPLLASSLKPEILIIDSASSDGTVEYAKNLGLKTISISQKEFNHGLTREKARKYLYTDIIIMMTDDAIAVDEHMLEKLIGPIMKNEAVISYARQIPHETAGFFEAFPRHFNYPEKSHIRSIFDHEKWGSYLFFCSNSTAAYLNSALDEVGGFPEVLLGEDTVVVAKLLKRGYKIAYVAEAKVKHSHAYTLKQEFQRYFDTGFARKSYEKLISSSDLEVQSDNKRGASFIKEMLKELIKKKPYLLPYAICNSFVKFFGFHLGRRAHYFPRSLKKAFSSQKYYW